MAQVIFKRKTTAEINELPIVDGQLIWNIETGETFIDIGTERIPTGGSGADGKSAYEIWLEQGNTGTEQDFIDSLKGETVESGNEFDKALEELKVVANKIKKYQTPETLTISLMSDSHYSRLLPEERTK